MEDYNLEYIKLEERIKALDHEKDFLLNELLSFSLNKIDSEMACKLCRLYFKSTTENLVYISIICAGHIARVYGRLVDQEMVAELKTIEKNASDPFRGVAETALDDIETYVDPNIRQ